MIVAHPNPFDAIQQALLLPPAEMIHEFEPPLSADVAQSYDNLDRVIANFEKLNREQSSGLRAAIDRASSGVRDGEFDDETRDILETVIVSADTAATESKNLRARIETMFINGAPGVAAAHKSRFKKRMARALKAADWRYNQVVTVYYRLLALRSEMDPELTVAPVLASTPDEVASLFAEIYAA